MPRRSLDTAMWGDPKFCDLSADGKLLFFRFVTGDDTTIAGAVRITSKRLAVDCGLTVRRSETAICELCDAGLLRSYDDGWYWIPAFIRRQLSGPGFIGGARKVAGQMPESLARAINRELDALLGERAETTRNGTNPSDKGRTRKSPTSRRKRGPTPRSDPGSDQGPTGERGSGPGQTDPTGRLSVLDKQGQGAGRAAGAGGATARADNEGDDMGKARHERVTDDGMLRWESDDIERYRNTDNVDFLREIQVVGTPAAKRRAQEIIESRDRQRLQVLDGGAA